MLKQVYAMVAIACLFGCGGSGGGTGPINNTSPPPGGISVMNNLFSPASKTVPVNTTVQWAWNSCTGDVYTGQTCQLHGVNFDDGVNSPTQDQGTYSRTFTAVGTYNYHCAVHGLAMSGSITVQ
jgi:plastocyanin